MLVCSMALCMPSIARWQYLCTISPPPPGSYSSFTRDHLSDSIVIIITRFIFLHKTLQEQVLVTTRCEAKPDCHPPGYSLSRSLTVRPRPSNQLLCLHLSQQLHFLSYAALANVTRTQLCGLGLDLPQNYLLRQCPLMGQKTNFRSFIYGHGSANPLNLVKTVW